MRRPVLEVGVPIGQNLDNIVRGVAIKARQFM